MTTAKALWKAKFERFFAEVPEERNRGSKRIPWNPRLTKIVSLYYGIGCEPYSAREVGEAYDVTDSRINWLLAQAKRVMEAHYKFAQSPQKQRQDSRDELLKSRFLKYFELVPKDLWFAGRKDAPPPIEQLHGVQRMFGIDCTPFGGGPVPSDYRHYGGTRALKVAESRLEQWERQQEVLEKRARLASNIKKQLEETA